MESTLALALALATATVIASKQPGSNAEKAIESRPTLPGGHDAPHGNTHGLFLEHSYEDNTRWNRLFQRQKTANQDDCEGHSNERCQCSARQKTDRAMMSSCSAA
ncbi:MAG: hypothetical protein JKY43_11080 [Phycisphaerales bacterium]|nr:hypothetical protein [Phycisphaerales bacterium]